MRTSVVWLLLFSLFGSSVPGLAAWKCRYNFIQVWGKPPTARDLSFIPLSGPMLPLEKREVKRTGMLVVTSRGRVVLLLAPFMAGRGHMGMIGFLKIEFSKPKYRGERIADIPWSGEIRFLRNGGNRTVVKEINTTSKMWLDWAEEQRQAQKEDAEMTGRIPSGQEYANTSQRLIDALSEYRPDLLPDDLTGLGHDWSEDPARDEHMDPYMADYARAKKGGDASQGNFRHDAENHFLGLICALDICLRGRGSVPLEKNGKNAFDYVHEDGRHVVELMRLLEEDGVRIQYGKVDHLARARAGLRKLLAQIEAAKEQRLIQERESKPVMGLELAPEQGMMSAAEWRENRREAGTRGLLVGDLSPGLTFSDFMTSLALVRDRYGELGSGSKENILNQVQAIQLTDP